MVYNEVMVNTMLRKTNNGLERQKIAVANINLFLAVSHKKKKDLAECMDKVPQALSKMLQNKQTWFFEICATQLISSMWVLIRSCGLILRP